MKINYRLLPVKAHYFCFMAALGPMLPQMNVFGKQLGISPVVMGMVTAVLPILFMIAKPTVGFLVDYFKNQRKTIFLSLIITMCASFGLLYFLPRLEQASDARIKLTGLCPPPICSESVNMTTSKLEAYCTYTCQQPNESFYNFKANLMHKESDFQICVDKQDTAEASECIRNRKDCGYNCSVMNTTVINDPVNLYSSVTFWAFVILMSLGTIAFNVTNCISDAICFDVLGNGGEMKYGKQRVWGTIGYGLTALLGGLAVDMYSQETYKDYMPAIVLMIAFTLFDLFSCKKLKLPEMTTPDSITGEVWKLLKQKHIAIFITFATMAGVLDSFIIYYLLWYMEEMAELTGYIQRIKLLEGLTIAAESFGGEVLFFLISGKILTKIGYGHSLTICFLCYAIRLVLISLVPNPWWVLPIELLMQGPTYALCYTTIVAYASAVAPEGASATVQGIVAGMDDGFGFSIGSLIGGFLYKSIGGARSFQVFSLIALSCSIIHCILYYTILKDTMHVKQKSDVKNEIEKGQYEQPQIALANKQDHI